MATTTVVTSKVMWCILTPCFESYRAFDVFSFDVSEARLHLSKQLSYKHLLTYTLRNKGFEDTMLSAVLSDLYFSRHQALKFTVSTLEF